MRTWGITVATLCRALDLPGYPRTDLPESRKRREGCLVQFAPVVFFERGRHVDPLE